MFLAIGALTGATIKYSRNALVDNWDGEGPYIFHESDSLLTINYIKGNRDDGFHVEMISTTPDASMSLEFY